MVPSTCHWNDKWRSTESFLLPDDQQNGIVDWTASGNEFMYVWGPQKEEAPSLPVISPPSGSAVTRAADVAETTGTNLIASTTRVKVRCLLKRQNST